MSVHCRHSMERAARGGSPGDMAAGSPAPARCSTCSRAFDAASRAPQLLACRHLACLACRALADREPPCAHCWGRGSAEPEGERCAAHALPALWCATCDAVACRACTDHAAHALRPAAEARAQLAGEALALREELQRLAAQRRAGLLRALDAAALQQRRLEASPAAGAGGSLAEAAAARGRLRAQCAGALLQWRLEELARRAGSQAPLGPGPEPRAAGPLYYLQLAVGGAACGRVVLAVRADAAPRMARNFGLLAAGAGGVGYAGCRVFRCWQGESVLAGDVERDDGRGGRSALAERGFLPDASRLAAVRGAVGMRRSQKRHDRLGLVGSQFRIVLREMRGFTAIFGAVVEGIELVDRLSRSGDSTGKPSSSIVISSCGLLE